MSGQQIGTVVGGIIGAYFGNPQLGMAIGGMIGGWIDPTKINGPHIGDGQQQTSTDGSPIAWVQGTAKIAGTLVWAGPRKEVKIKDSGKGGPEVSHYESRQSFAILICESSDLRDSTINNVLMVEQDGKLVYDVRDGSSIKSDSTKWAKNVTFYYGAEDQMPPSVIEADVGVGNCPAYRGVLLAVFQNFNTYAAGDRIPNFLFTVSQTSSSEIVSPGQKWKYDTAPEGVWDDRNEESYDDSSWPLRDAPIGNASNALCSISHDFDSSFPPYIQTQITPDPSKDYWLRKYIYLHDIPDQNGTLKFCTGEGTQIRVFINGMLWTHVADGTGSGVSTELQYSYFKKGWNTVALCLSVDEDSELYGDILAEFVMPDGLSLETVAKNICLRGGLNSDDVDASELQTAYVIGYPVARQCTGADALQPLLASYFSYATDYDEKLIFNFLGADAQITVSQDDLVEGNDANDSAITQTTRNQATEFPRKITVSYIDPDQNYNTITVPAERTSVNVLAIGEQSVQVPVVMSADDAAKVADKAMKVAYAKLEGTRDYCLPFARTATYLTVCAGEPVLMDGKRWVLDQCIISNGYIKFATTYDRQSAYVSNVQAIKGNDPRPPTSRYSGPTTLIAMNLPSLRPQDTYGVYLAAKGTNDQTNWRGCNVLVSYDDQQSWQNAVTITIDSVIGQLSEEIPSAGEPLTVDVGDGELDSITDDQLDARMNGFALIDSSDVAEIGQFKTADLLSSGEYELIDVSRGLLGTDEGTHAVGDSFVMLDSVYFLPIDTSFADKTIYFKAVGFGESADNAVVVSLVYKPDTTIIYDGGEVT